MNDESYMRFALELARSVKGQTNPNPPVGAVVVKNGEILGFGAHLKAGEAHAEKYALDIAGEKAEGATIYVTLEPCSHYGKTGPCAKLIVEKKLKRVVIAMKDPNEKVAGKGIEQLLAAGLEVKVGVLEEEAKAINDVFFHFISTKTPYVTVKSAVSLDGKTATHTSVSKWITSEEARLDVHRYRHRHDAILVGVQTVLKDNPKLTTRLPHGGKNPVRIILDTTLKTPLDANVVTDHAAETWIFVGNNVSEVKKAQFNEKNYVRIIQLEETNVQIKKVLRYLGDQGIASVFVEGGATVNGSFLQEKLINQVILYMAPKLIGGKDAPTSFAGDGFTTVSESLSLDIIHVEKIGPDLKLIAIPREDE